jgi:maltooligosyltrehalose trehalohydrolase
MKTDLPAMSGHSVLSRRLPIGAELVPAGGVHFRVWAPAAADVAVTIDGKSTRLAKEAGGYFSGSVIEAAAGTQYSFRLDGRESHFPDPASRFQPSGPHGPSEVIDPTTFVWTDDGWSGVPQERIVIYEVHIGTFTPEGTWSAAAEHLHRLAELGITCIEMMPVADFPGRFGWGYDGVDLFAPTRLYGRPDDLRQFVDRAHGAGIAVILDVVYNHIGPDGNYLTAFAAAYFTDRYQNEWGAPLNFDGPDSGPVREFFIENAGYWIDEFHFDGLRLDATQQIFDTSAEHVVAAIGQRVREKAPGRTTFITTENEVQDARLVRPLSRGGYALDSIWNDDFHHSAMVALTGRAEAYYSDYSGRAAEFVALAKSGFLFQGQRSAWQKQARGTPSLDLRGRQFVTYLQNHDQIANSDQGLRGHQLTAPGLWRAMTAYLLLGPSIPLLFQGQEYAVANPFLFFADHQGDLGGLVGKGRREFLAQFPSLASPDIQATLADPSDPNVFHRCVLEQNEERFAGAAYALHRDLLALRRADAAFDGTRPLDGAALREDAWLLRYFAGQDADRLLIVNLGRDLVSDTIAEPLLAPPAGLGWQMQWSSEAPLYGGAGTPDPIPGGEWHIPGHAAILLKPAKPT